MLEPKSLRELTLLFSRFPGIGPKSAKRLAVHIFKEDSHFIKDFIKILENISSGVQKCKFCGVYTDSNPCEVCADVSRDFLKLFLVKNSLDLYAVENSGVFKGQYLVLEDFDFDETYNTEKLVELVKKVRDRVEHLIGLAKKHQRINKESIFEIIFGFGTTIEEQTVLLFIKSRLSKSLGKQIPLRFSRLAIGLSPGGALDYVDQFTLAEALKGRQKI